MSFGWVFVTLFRYLAPKRVFFIHVNALLYFQRLKPVDHLHCRLVKFIKSKSLQVQLRPTDGKSIQVNFELGKIGIMG